MRGRCFARSFKDVSKQKGLAPPVAPHEVLQQAEAEELTLVWWPTTTPQDGLL